MNGARPRAIAFAFDLREVFFWGLWRKQASGLFSLGHLFAGRTTQSHELRGGKTDCAHRCPALRRGVWASTERYGRSGALQLARVPCLSPHRLETFRR